MALSSGMARLELAVLAAVLGAAGASVYSTPFPQVKSIARLPASSVNGTSGQGIVFVSANVSVVAAAHADPLLGTITARYTQLLRNKASALAGKPLDPTVPVLARVSATLAAGGGFAGSTELGPHTDESYELKVEVKGGAAAATVTARSVFGLRLGLETLAQLVI